MGHWGLSRDVEDPYLILAATGGRLTTDMFEFVPLLYPKTGTSFRSDVAGFKFYDGSASFRELPPGAWLDLQRDPGNEYDPAAVQVLHAGQKVGYIKKVHSQSVTRALVATRQVSCQLVDVASNGMLKEFLVNITFA